MATISGCRHLKVNLKAKIYIYVNCTIQRCPNKIIKIFLLEGFFHLPPVSLTPVANLELRISPLGSRGNVYINFCLQVHFQVSAAWYCSHYLRPMLMTPVAIRNLPPWLANISANFGKNSKWSYCYYQGLGGRWFMKKTWSKNLVTLSF